MATLSSILNVSLSSLEANQASLAVVSNNLANSNDPDYTQQTLVTTPGVDADGDLSAGTGVQIIGIQAIRDNLLNQAVTQATSAQSSADALSSTLSDIEPQFSDNTTTGLLSSVTSFFNSFQTLSTDPSSPGFLEAVQTSAQNMIAGFQQVSSALTQEQEQMNQAVPEAVTQINSLASQIATLTGQIAQQGTGDTSQANDLIDQRETLVNQLAQITNVQEINSGGGNYQLITGNDIPLVVGSTAIPLTTQQGTNGETDIYSGQNDVTSEISGGSLQAQIAVRDTYVPKYQDAIDHLAYGIVQQVNSVASTGYNANGDTGINFFAPLSSSQGAASQMALSSQVVADPSNIPTGSQAGDGDNQVALQLGNLITQPVFNGGSVTDQYQNIVFTVGTDASNANEASTAQDALASQLQTQQQSVSGVSIDEETTQMLQFQRAYQASAQLINTVNQLLQTAMGLAAATS